jgi:hypothetical protein
MGECGGEISESDKEVTNDDKNKERKRRKRKKGKETQPTMHTHTQHLLLLLPRYNIRSNEIRLADLYKSFAAIRDVPNERRWISFFLLLLLFLIFSGSHSGRSSTHTIR